jgi:hypothetical protein
MAVVISMGIFLLMSIGVLVLCMGLVHIYKRQYVNVDGVELVMIGLILIILALFYGDVLVKAMGG